MISAVRRWFPLEMPSPPAGARNFRNKPEPGPPVHSRYGRTGRVLTHRISWAPALGLTRAKEILIYGERDHRFWLHVAERKRTEALGA